MLREDGFVGLSLAPNATSALLRTKPLSWMGGEIALNVDCGGRGTEAARSGGRVRLRCVRGHTSTVLSATAVYPRAAS
jgi:hypothetical protein